MNNKANHFIEDDRLSLKAKGILTYIYSKSNDWAISQSEIAKSSKDGASSVKTAFDELMKLGYLTRKIKREDNGNFNGYEYTVHELPSE